jgi:hypothetical protein
LTARILPHAEAELTAFIQAVDELFGPDEARESAEDWMEELESAQWSAEGTPFNWRSLTIAAAVRLAARINVGLAKHRSNQQSADRHRQAINTSKRRTESWQVSTRTTIEPF